MTGEAPIVRGEDNQGVISPSRPTGQRPGVRRGSAGDRRRAGARPAGRNSAGRNEAGPAGCGPGDLPGRTGRDGPDPPTPIPGAPVPVPRSIRSRHLSIWLPTLLRSSDPLTLLDLAPDPLSLLDPLTLPARPF